MIPALFILFIPEILMLLGILDLELLVQDILFLVFPLLFFPLSIVIGIRPFCFYENGYEMNVPFGTNKFIPYNDLIGMESGRWFWSKNYIFVFKRKFLGRHVKMLVPMDVTGLAENLEHISMRIKCAPPVPSMLDEVTPESSRRFRLVEHIAYFAVIACCYFVARSIDHDFPETEITDHVIFIFTAVTAAVLIPIMTALIAQPLLYMAKNMPKFRTRSLSMASIGTIFVASALIMAVNAGSLFNLNPTFDPDPGPAPASSALSSGNYSDMKIYPQGDVFISSGALNLVNVTMVLEDGHQIWIDPGGTLYAERCIFESNGSFMFRVLGTMQLIESEVYNLEGHIDWSKVPEEYGGIEIYSGNATIINCTIAGGNTRGIMVSNTYAYIGGNNISGFQYEGIVLVNASANIHKNELSGMEDGIYIQECNDIVISDNYIHDSAYGIDIVASNAIIENNNISVSDIAIVYDEGSEPVMNNNTLRADYIDVNVYVEPEVEFCITGIIIVFIVIFAILFYQNRKLRSQP